MIEKFQIYNTTGDLWQIYEYDESQAIFFRYDKEGLIIYKGEAAAKKKAVELNEVYENDTRDIN